MAISRTKSYLDSATVRETFKKEARGVNGTDPGSVQKRRQDHQEMRSLGRGRHKEKLAKGVQKLKGD